MNNQMKRHIGWDLEGSRAQDFCPHGVGVSHPLGMWMCSPIRKLSKPHSLGIFREASSHRYDQPLFNLQPFDPPRRTGGRAENSKLLLNAWSFWWPGPMQKPTKNCIIRTKHTPIAQKIPRDLVPVGSQLLIPPFLRKLQGFQELSARIWGQRTIYTFLIISQVPCLKRRSQDCSIIPLFLHSLVLSLPLSS